ncbi:MAG: prepilin-type N-terminal cleavage/methylation domain-containing protein [Nitrospiraceae bacterium]|nr:prepilin-type N-terminal cleavage/methylation domain-containing protein [Nitrospiraceae bacterium]
MKLQDPYPAEGGLQPVRMRGERGFTLLELIIVLFLVALIFGISTVYLANSLPAGKFNAAVRDIASSIRHARALAQIDGTAQAVTIDMETKKYGIEGKDLRPFPPDVQVRVIDPFSGAVTEGKYTFHFSPSGGSDGGTIVVWNAKRTVSIVVDPVVGAIVMKGETK